MNPLFDIDKQFCNDCQTGKQNAWMNYLADATIMGTQKHEPYITDKSYIRSIMKMLFERDHLSFTWKPIHGELSEDKTLGYTSGTYQRTYQKDGETIREIGKYVTIWKQVGDTYKVIFDMGN